MLRSCALAMRKGALTGLLLLVTPATCTSLTLAKCTMKWDETRQCGRARPLYDISTCDVKDVISNVFRRNGFTLQSPFRYVHSHSAFILDGYDPRRRAGYILLAGLPWCREYGNITSPLEKPIERLLPDIGFTPGALGSEVTSELTKAWQQEQEMRSQRARIMADMRMRAMLYWRMSYWWAVEPWPSSVADQLSSLYDMPDVNEATRAFDSLLNTTLGTQDAMLRTARGIPDTNVFVTEAEGEPSYIIVISLFDPRYLSSSGHADDDWLGRYKSVLGHVETSTTQYLLDAKTLGLE